MITKDIDFASENHINISEKLNLSLSILFARFCQARPLKMLVMLRGTYIGKGLSHRE